MFIIYIFLELDTAADWLETVLKEKLKSHNKDSGEDVRWEYVVICLEYLQELKSAIEESLLIPTSGNALPGIKLSRYMKISRKCLLKIEKVERKLSHKI